MNDTPWNLPLKMPLESWLSGVPDLKSTEKVMFAAALQSHGKWSKFPFKYSFVYMPDIVKKLKEHLV